jgi:hypothetical protein
VDTLKPKKTRPRRLPVLERYGKLKVLAKNGRKLHCLCDCGNECYIELTNINRGYTNSCGCLAKEKWKLELDGFKVCSKCHIQFPLEKFSVQKTRTSGYACWCKACVVKNSSMHRQNNKIKHMYWAIKVRANKKKIEFNIGHKDLIIPEKCPLLGIPLNEPQSGKLSKGSPSVDRFDPSKGYVKGNIWVISNRANTLKNNASIEELELLVKNLKKEIKRRKEDEE